jgi:divalent metal cation (Fe/Co/Zn/Cd) transporter
MAEYAETHSPHQGSEQTCGIPPSQNRSILWLQLITIGWMLLECIVSLVSAKAACSPSLLEFGSDSLVELLSATVVLFQFIPSVRLNSTRASKIAGILLYVLSGLVALISILGWVTDARPEASLAGIGITAAALVVMPVLAWRKRSLARRTGNTALAADAVQSATCAYLAAITLAGLAANALLRIPWLDSAAALIAVPFLIKEAKAAMRGEGCACCSS